MSLLVVAPCRYREPLCLSPPMATMKENESPIEPTRLYTYDDTAPDCYCDSDSSCLPKSGKTLTEALQNNRKVLK